MSFGESLETVLTRNRAALLRQAERLCKGDARFDAEDLVQDVFIRFGDAFKGAPLPDERGCAAWLATTLRNSFISHLRKTQSQLRLRCDPALGESMFIDPEPTPRLYDIVTEEELNTAVRALSRKHRETFEAITAGRSYDEVAGSLGITRGAVAKRLHDARRRLRQALANNESMGKVLEFRRTRDEISTLSRNARDLPKHFDDAFRELRKPPSSDVAAALCKDFETRFGPNALRLATVSSLATRIESALLRRLRLELVPEAPASTEAELWFSALVESWGPKAFVLRADVVEWLRERLSTEDPARVLAAHNLVDQLHASGPEALRLEEAAVWAGLQEPWDESNEVEKRFRSAVRTMISNERAGLGVARWAARAIPRLPRRAVQSSEAVRLLAFGAAARLPAQAAVERVVDEGLMGARWLLPASIGTKDVRVGRTRTGFAVLDPSSGAGALVPVPATTPLVLEILWREGASERRTGFIAEPGASVDVPPSAEAVRLRTLEGELFELRRGWAVVDALIGKRQEDRVSG